MRVVVLLLFGVLTAMPGVAATRLGLHITSEERALWQARMTDNVNTINGFTYQAIYQTRILPEANEFVSMPTPKDGFWAGYTGAGCHPGGQSPAPGDGPLERYGRGNGAVMVRAALVYVLTGTTSYATAIKNALVTQANEPGTDWTNASKWCFDQMTGGAMLEIIPWLYRMLLAYDYLKAGGYTGWTAGEEQTIRDWLYAGAVRWDTRWVESMAPSPYPGVFAEPQDLTLVGGTGPNFGVLWFGGPTVWYNTYFPWYNQPANVLGLSMAAGIVFNDPVLITHAKKWAMGFITAGTWSNGANADFSRWGDCVPGCPGSMWAHAMSPMGWLIAAADALARTGDTSLYDLSVTSQVIGGGGGTSSVLKSLQLWAQMINKTVTLYGTTDSGDLVPERVLTWDSDIDPGNPGWVSKGNYYDMSLMLANLYYQDPQVHTAMLRTTLGANSHLGGVGCNDAQYGGCFVGAYNFWPDLPFLWGNMEGQVDPYTLTEPAPVLDDFNRANQGPPPSTNWTTAALAGQPGLEVLNNTLVVDTINTSSAWWNASTFPANVRVTADWADATVSAVRHLRLYLRLTQPGVAGQTTGYVCQAEPTPAVVDGGLHLRRVDAGALSAVLATASSVPWATGDALKCEMVGTELCGFRRAAGSGIWTELVCLTDTTYTTGSAVGIGLNHPEVAADNFDAAAVLSAPPIVAITAPTSSPTFATSTSPLTTLAGTASDDVAVTSVSVACSPSCGTPVVSGTTPWSVASLPLQSGDNSITVTATDGDLQSAQDVLTVTYTPPVPATSSVIVPFSGHWAR